MPRAPQATDHGVQSLPEIGQVIGRTVGERLVSLGPGDWKDKVYRK